MAQSCPTLRDPMNRSTPGLPVHHQLLEFTQTHVHQVSDAIQPSHPLSSPSPLAPNPPSIRVFSNESTLRMRWPKYWSFSFSIIPSKEIPFPKILARTPAGQERQWEILKSYSGFDEQGENIKYLSLLRNILPYKFTHRDILNFQEELLKNYIKQIFLFRRHRPHH